jgi:hypothetical protein
VIKRQQFHRYGCLLSAAAAASSWGCQCKRCAAALVKKVQLKKLKKLEYPMMQALKNRLTVQTL